MIVYSKIETDDSTPARKRPDAGSVKAGIQATILAEAGKMWDKLTADDLASVKSSDDLVARITDRYGAAKAKVEREVSALLNGRHF